MNLSDYMENLIDHSIATEEEITLVTSINGWTIETMNDILEARTSYKNWYQYANAELGEEE